MTGARTTKVQCEWVYYGAYPKAMQCPNHLTEREVEYCKGREEFDGKFFCYGHQGQYLITKTTKKPDLSGKGGE
jgi:hypothetical protein